MIQQGQQTKSFAQSEEAQEYIQKLQQGKAKLPDNASPLEAEALDNLNGLGKRHREINTAISDMDKEAARIKQQRDSAVRELDIVSGQMSAFAGLLVSAEGARREGPPMEHPRPVPPNAKPEPEPEAEAEAEAEAEPEPKKVSSIKKKVTNGAKPAEASA